MNFHPRWINRSCGILMNVLLKNQVFSRDLWVKDALSKVFHSAYHGIPRSWSAVTKRRRPRRRILRANHLAEAPKLIWISYHHRRRIRRRHRHRHHHRHHRHHRRHRHHRHRRHHRHYRHRRCIRRRHYHRHHLLHLHHPYPHCRMSHLLRHRYLHHTQYQLQVCNLYKKNVHPTLYFNSFVGYHFICIVFIK